MEMFRACPGESHIAISIDKTALEKHNQSPFHLDDLREIQIPILHCLQCIRTKLSSGDSAVQRSSKRSSVLARIGTSGSVIPLAEIDDVTRSTRSVVNLAVPKITYVSLNPL